MDFATTLILVFLGILLEAFFSGAEIGMVSVNRIKMKKMAEDGNSAARSILKLLDDPERLFTTTSLGTNLAMVSSTAIFTAFMVTHFGDSGEWMAMIIISPLIFFGGGNHSKSHISAPCGFHHVAHDLSVDFFLQGPVSVYNLAIKSIGEIHQPGTAGFSTRT